MSFKSVFCIAVSRFQAEHIVEQLRNAGFNSHDVSALLPEKKVAGEFGEDRARAPHNRATHGAKTGGMVGGAIGWLAGVGVLAIPGAGPLLVAGPLVATLSGAALGAAMGGIGGALANAGIPEPAARQYEDRVRSGNILISVCARGAKQLAAAIKIFQALGALDISMTGGSSHEAQGEMLNANAF